MLVSPEKKQETREISRKKTLRVAGELLSAYHTQKASGWIAVDVRGGKAIWVRPVVANIECRAEAAKEGMVLRQLAAILRESQEKSASGTVTIVVCRGRAVALGGAVELDKMRVG